MYKLFFCDQEIAKVENKLKADVFILEHKSLFKSDKETFLVLVDEEKVFSSRQFFPEPYPEGKENWYVGEFLEGNEEIGDTLNLGSSFFGNWEDDGIEEDLKTFLKRMEKFTK